MLHEAIDKFVQSHNLHNLFHSNTNKSRENGDHIDGIMWFVNNLLIRKVINFSL